MVRVLERMPSQPIKKLPVSVCLSDEAAATLISDSMIWESFQPSMKGIPAS
jgi:hypothetical protein